MDSNFSAMALSRLYPINCGDGNPAEPCLKGTTLYLNAPTNPCLPPETPIGTEGSTWGTMKSLFTAQGGSAAR